jgi:hypothetical protein
VNPKMQMSNRIDIRTVILEFKTSCMRWPGHQAGMTIEVNHLKRSALPQYLMDAVPYASTDAAQPVEEATAAERSALALASAAEAKALGPEEGAAAPVRAVDADVAGGGLGGTTAVAENRGVGADTEMRTAGNSVECSGKVGLSPSKRCRDGSPRKASDAQAPSSQAPSSLGDATGDAEMGPFPEAVSPSRAVPDPVEGSVEGKSPKRQKYNETEGVGRRDANGDAAVQPSAEEGVFAAIGKGKRTVPAANAVSNLNDNGALTTAR